MKSPAFLLYYKDFLADTAAWEAYEVGWAIRLLCHQARHGYIPADEEKMATIAGVKFSQYDKFRVSLRDTLRQYFSEMPSGNLHHEHTTKILQDQQKKTATKSILGHLANYIKYKNITLQQKNWLKKGFKDTDFLEFSEEERKEKIYTHLNQKLKQHETLSVSLSDTLYKADVNVNSIKKEKVLTPEEVQFENIKIFKAQGLSRRQLELYQRNLKITPEEADHYLEIFISENFEKFKNKPVPMSYLNQAIANIQTRFKNDSPNNNKTSQRSTSTVLHGSEDYDYELPT